MSKYSVQCGKMDNGGRLDVKVKFNTGKVYHVVFCDTAYIEGELGDLGCVAIPGLIALDEVSMERVHQVIGAVVRSGYFDSLVPVEDGE